MGDRTKLCDYTNTPNDQFIAKPITTPEITAESYEVSPSLLNLIDRKSTRLNSSHSGESRMPSSA